VWTVLTDVAAYPDWWPSAFGSGRETETPESVGTDWEVRSLLAPTVRLRLEELEPPDSVRIRFFGEALEGPGGFHLTPAEGGTRITYAVDVFARGLGVAALSHVLPLGRIYGLRMKGVLRSLRGRLESQRRQADRVAAVRVAEEAAATPLVSDSSSNFEVARRYLQALSSEAEPISIASHFQPDALSEEFPNRILPAGATRDLDELLRTWSNQREVWAEQSFELLGATGGGSQVAMEVRWTARPARGTEHFEAGQQVGANLALFLKFREQRIVRQRSYFSFEYPPPQPGPPPRDAVHTATGARGDSPPLTVVPGPWASNFEIARAYFGALSAGASGQAVARFFAEDAVQEDLPSRFNPAGVRRGLRAIQRARDERLAALSSEHYELLGATGVGSKVALELWWEGIAGPGHVQYKTGNEVQARKAVFLKFRNGLIVRRRTYECA
jgi:ketosteroid isomerase-like protein